MNSHLGRMPIEFNDHDMSYSWKPEVSMERRAATLKRLGIKPHSPLDKIGPQSGSYNAPLTFTLPDAMKNAPEFSSINLSPFRFGIGIPSTPAAPSPNPTQSKPSIVQAPARYTQENVKRDAAAAAKVNSNPWFMVAAVGVPIIGALLLR